MDQPVPVTEPDSGGMRLDRVVAELRQWHVFRVAAGYTVAAWVLVQVIDTIGPAFDLPDWVLRAVVLAAIVGFLATMAFMLFRPRSTGKGRIQVYLSRRTRLVAGAAVLAIAGLAAALSIRSLGAREEVALAVLPFADLSPARDKAFFAEGVAEEILSTLAAEKGIKVLGRTSARQIERDPDPKAIRASLGVTHLLEGSARTAGDSLRVNVRLVDTADGSQLWEEEYDGKLADVFQVQDKIASTVVKRLRGTLLGGADKSATTAIDAYQTYLAARALQRTRTKPTLEQAMELARKVIAADPRYAPGHALYAELLFQLSDDIAGYGDLPIETIRPIAERHARLAIKLAPAKGEGYAALGLIQPGAAAVASFKKAIALDPARAEVRLWLGSALNALGRVDEGAEQYVAASEIEPLWPTIINQVVRLLSASAHFDEAKQVVSKFRQRGGAENHALRFLAAIASYQNDFSGALALNRAALAKDPATPYVEDYIGQFSGFLGLTEQSLASISGRQPYVRMFYSGQREALRERVLADGADAWNAQGTDYGIFTLATFRDWPALARIYDWRPKVFADYCQSDPPRAPLMALALAKVGRSAEAQGIIACSHRRADLELSMRNRWQAAQVSPEFRKAALLAIRGDRRGLDWLERAVARGWVGQPFSPRLSDWPQFDPYRADPRYAALQKRIDAVIARERREAIADL